jgi:hypothetical protein
LKVRERRVQPGARRAVKVEICLNPGFGHRIFNHARRWPLPVDGGPERVQRAAVGDCQPSYVNNAGDLMVATGLKRA